MTHPNHDIDDVAASAAIGLRLKEARTYLGLTQGDVADALGFARTTVQAVEAGKRKLTGLEARRFARLYRRSVAWLLGEETTEPVGEALFRATATLTDEDREQVLKFAQFLAAAGGSQKPQPGPGGSAVE